ncbi:MAG: hypothetical protein JWL92_558 [Candidatus Nomurabacteria bacterium]|nr:hypothetical protein [Candidatus Nomurabacteria bacterium]
MGKPLKDTTPADYFNKLSFIQQVEFIQTIPEEQESLLLLEEC